tara:strand:+ start:11463 stop:12524 length:1062 start_codon:yes stop_codon:yes gene_type:complete
MKSSSNKIIINVDSTTLSSDEYNLLQNEIIGGVILFNHNYDNLDQIKLLIDSIKSIRGDIMIAVDHEGGRVQRFRKGFTLLPSFEDIGKLYLQDPELANEVAYSSGYVSGFELKKIGIDINFSPVVDLSSNSEVLNNRTLSINPDTVTRLASEYIRGLIDNGIIPTLKHFPGHGSVLSDTHTTVSECDNEYKDLITHIEPFKRIYKKYQVPIMTSHIIYNKISEHPVTTSSTWLLDHATTIYDKKPFFISDDLEMSAISEKYNNDSKIDILIKAFSAGCNLAIITTMQTKGVIESNLSHQYFKSEYLDKLADIERTSTDNIDLLCLEHIIYNSGDYKIYQRSLECLDNQFEIK